MPDRRQFLAAFATSIAAAACWVPSLSTVFGPTAGTLAGDPYDPVIAGLLERQLQLWENGRDDLDDLRQANPEWDFMGRTLLGLALLNTALRAPEQQPRLLGVVDQILDTTLEQLERHGMHHFLLSYGRGPFHNPTGRSLFVDGELLALIAARELVVGDARYGRVQSELAGHVVQNMRSGRLGHGESYPDECWSFCNAFASVGLRLDSHTSARDHHAVLAGYRQGLNALVDPSTGMLISEYTRDGAPQDGPEGSSLYLTSAFLLELDPPLARQQYALAQQHLLRRAIGFGYSREWPAGQGGYADVDSGPIVPGFEASAGASGLAFLGAAAMQDHDTLQALLASLWATGFPTWEGERLHFAASNAVGDAVLLYALVQGPLFARMS